MGKVIWKSRTFWVNLITLTGMLSSEYFGIKITPEVAASSLVIINFILRLITKEPIVWSKEDE